MLLNQLFTPAKILSEGGNLASHTPTGEPTVGYAAGIPGVHKADKIDSKNRAAMVPVVKQLLVDINNTFARQYGRVIWNSELIEKEVQEFISGSSKWFMFLRQPNPNFDPKQPVSDANPKEIGIEDGRFHRVKKKVGDIDTQIDRNLEPQITEFLQKNNGKNIGSASLAGFKKGTDQWLALWKINEPPITLQVDLEFSDYTTDERGFEIPTEWAQVSHGSQLEDLEEGIKGVFRQWLYRSIAKVSPTAKYIAKVTGAGKNKSMRLFGGDDGKELIGDINNPPPPLNDANFSFAVASAGGGGIRAKYRQPTPQENVPAEINGVPVMVPLTPAESEYVKDMSQQFEQFFGIPAEGNETKMMASMVGTIALMKQHFTTEQQQIAVQEFLKINFGNGAQMIDANDPTSDFKTKMVAIDYLLDNTGLKSLRKQALTMAKEYENAYNAKNAQTESLNEAEVKAQLRKGMPHLHDLKAPDFLDLLDEIHDGNGQFKLQNIPLNVKVDGFGGRFGKNADGKPFMGTSRTEPRYEAGFVAYHQKKGTDDPDILRRAQLFDDLFAEMMKAVALVDSKLGSDFLVNKQVTCEVLYLPFATETPEGKLKFVGIAYDKLPSGIQLALVPFRVVDADTGEDLPNSNDYIKQLLSVGKSNSVMFIDNSLTQNQGLDVTEIINPLDNIEELKTIVSATAGKRDRTSLQLKKEIEEKLQPIKIALEKAIINDPNIIGKDLLGQDYEGIVINSRLGPIKVTSQEQRDVISAKNAAKVSARTERPRSENKTAVVAIGSFVGHKGHQDLFKYTVDKAKELGGDPYLFIGNAEGKNDPIPPAVKVQTWHKLYPAYAKNISTVTQEGGSLLQKIKHELINPLPGKPPRYDNIIIMVGEDQAGLTMPQALMKAVNKFPGYEHVKVTLGVTPRESGFSGTMLRNSLKNDAPEEALAKWSSAFDVNKLGIDWIKHLMDLTRKAMNIQQKPQQAVPVTERILNALIYPKQYFTEAPIEMDPAEPMNPMIYGAGANPAKLKDRMARASGQLKDLAQRAQNASPLEWEIISRHFTELTMNIEQIRHALEELAKKRKKGGVSSRGIDPNIGEGWRDEAEDFAGWSDYVKEKLANASPEQRPGLASRLSQLEVKHFGSSTHAGFNGQTGKPIAGAGLTDTVRRILKSFGKEADDVRRAQAAIDGRDGPAGNFSMPFGSVDVAGLENAPPEVLRVMKKAVMLGADVAAAARNFYLKNGTLTDQDLPKIQMSLANNASSEWKQQHSVAEGSGFDQEAGIGIDGKSFKFKIRDLVALADNYPVTKIDPQQFSKQIAGRDEDSTQSMARAEKADLQYPIIVVKRQNGQLWIADGTHRAHKAIMHKLPSINAKIIPIKDMAPFDVDQGVAEGVEGSIDLLKKLDAMIKNFVQTRGQMGGQRLSAGMLPILNNLEQLGEKDIAHGIKNMVVDARNTDRTTKGASWSLLAQGLSQKLPELIRTRMKQGVAEGVSGSKYKVKSVGQDKKGEYYISPSTGEKVYKKAKVGDHEVPGSKEIKPKLEAMLPKTAFAGSDKNKLGPAAHLKGSMKRPARQGDLVGGSAQESTNKKKGADGKACWKGYRYNGTKNGKDSCVPIGEHLENRMSKLISILESK